MLVVHTSLRDIEDIFETLSNVYTKLRRDMTEHREIYTNLGCGVSECIEMYLNLRDYCNLEKSRDRM